MHTDAFIVGRSVVLRPVRESDAKYFTQWVNNPIVRKYLLTRTPMSSIAEKDWIAKQSKSERYPESIVMVIEARNFNRPMGLMGLNNINWIDRIATTGSMIGDIREQGKGYATDAKMHFLQYVFEVLGIHKVISRAHAENTASIRYSERCGYVREAILREEIFREGKWVDMIQLACFYEDWKKAWSAFLSTGV